MGLLSPVYVFVLPFLFIFTLPIFILATVTTFLAFSLLFFRVALVYIALAVAVIPHYLSLLVSTNPTPSKPPPMSRARSFTTSSSTRRKRRRASSTSVTGTITPISGSGMGLSQSVGATRDFEGVGGWRLGGDEDENDALWTGINSRLELPADHGRRHHRRSLTSGSMEAFVINTSRMKTPPATAVFGDGYFPSTPKAGLKRNSSNTGSSGSSKSSVLGMKGR